MTRSTMTTTGVRVTPARICPHTPPCPDANAIDREAAHTVTSWPEQGWSLLCNGVIMFDDTGDLLPDRTIIAPHRGPAPHRPHQETTPGR